MAIRVFMNWLYIAIAAYFLLALTQVGDKLVVSKYLSSPRLYAITVALLQGTAILFLPFLGELAGWSSLLLDIVVGAVFIAAIYYFYQALQSGETSRVIPALDGLVPIVVLALSFIILGDQVAWRHILAIILLIGGGFLLAYQSKTKKDFNLKYLLIAVLLLAVYQVLAKLSFNTQPFWSAFLWARFGGLLTVLPFLLFPNIRAELRANFGRQGRAGSSTAVLLTQLSGGTAFILQNYAIKLGNVSVVSALQGIKYFFLFVLIILFSKKFIQLKEDWSGGVLLRKIGGTALVVGGLVLLVI